MSIIPPVSFYFNIQLSMKKSRHVIHTFYVAVFIFQTKRTEYVIVIQLTTVIP